MTGTLMNKLQTIVEFETKHNRLTKLCLKNRLQKKLLFCSVQNWLRWYTMFDFALKLQLRLISKIASLLENANVWHEIN